MSRLLFLTPVSIALALTVRADTFVPLTLPTLDTDIRTYTDGAAYNPLFPSDQSLAGVPFHFAVQSGLNPAGAPVEYTAYIDSAHIDVPGSAPLHIPVNQVGVTTAYTLINTTFGADGALAGTLDFQGTGGASYHVDLTEGVNVRDHLNGVFVNTTSDPSTTDNVFGDPGVDHAHLDMQTFTLPAAFATETLQEIIFTPLPGEPNGRAFLVAATVEVPGTSAPDAGSTFGLLGLPAALLLAMRKQFAR